MDDLAELAVNLGQNRRIVLSMLLTRRPLLIVSSSTIGSIVGKIRPVISVSPTIGSWSGWLIGKLMGEVLITRDEITGLMQDLLYTNSPATGTTKLSDWAKEHAAILGSHYSRELKRRLYTDIAYEDS
jgi:hypothetical protein